MIKVLKNICIAAFWLVVWQIAALIVHNKILLAGPVETLMALVRMSGEAEFWGSIWNSYAGIMAGIILGIVLGIGLAVLSFKYEIIGMFLSPLVATVKAIPVASFIILILIWLGNEHVSTFVSMLVVFPILYVGTSNGLKAADKKLLEMAHVYRMPALNKFKFIYFPAIIPFLISAFSLAIGMGFKSGVAAEVIGQPLMSMGNSLYRAKIFLDTGDLFAWTFVIIMVSWVTEKLVLLILSLVKRC